MIPPAASSGQNAEESKERPSHESLIALFARVMSTLEKSIPYDAAQLLFLEDEETAQSVTVQRGKSEQPKPIPTQRRRYSGKLWPTGDATTHIIENGAEALDPNWEGDRALLESGVQSLILAPLNTEHGEVGLLLMTSNQPSTFNSSHTHALGAITEYLAIATEREQLWEKEQIRQRRRAKFETLVPTIAQSLDVRKVFVQMSAVIKEVVPHDVLAFALISPDRGGVRVQAATVMGVMELPEYRFSTEQEALDANWQFLLAYDLSPVDAESVRARISPRHVDPPVEVVVRPGKNWVNFVTRARIRSTMRVPIRSKDKPIGGIAFMSSKPDAYDAEDGMLASRITDLVALSLAHQALGEEIQRKGKLAALDAALPQLEALHDIDDIAVTVSRLARNIIEHDVAGVMVAHSNGGHIHGVLKGTERMSMEATPEFMEAQFQGVRESGVFLMRDLEILDPEKRLVRQHLIKENARVPNELTITETEFDTIRATGVRSELRVAVKQGDEMVGAILFASHLPDHYTEEDTIVAKRFAEHVSLRLARERVETAVRRTREVSAQAKALEERVEQLQHELEQFSAHRAIGTSASWKEALALAAQVATTDTTVLVTGESGTGKEVIARYIHRGSKRAKGPFIALNCAAISEHLLESELFGHERGAFTGAVEARAGKVEQAAGGVLFLDEIGEMPPPMQAKLLRVLQEREFNRVGGSRTIKADVRIVAATNRDPRAAIAKGTFREDLYYRLSTFEIHLPPLRERPEDILPLAEAFLGEVGRSIGRPAAGISEDAREQLLVHSWPGNVRELRNAIERAVILCQGGLVTREHLPISISRPQAERIAVAAPAAAEFPVEGVALETVEREMLVKAMAKAKNNKSQAAKLLGISRGQLYSLLQKHGLTDAKR